MKSPLRIKDNRATEKRKFSEIKNLVEKIADKTLAHLETENIFIFPELKQSDDLTKEQMILETIDDKFRTRNVMGFLGCGDEKLIIESRFCGDEKNEEAKDYFFQYLLCRVLDFPNIMDLKIDANRENQLFNFFLFLFPYYLKTAMRKGVFKEYIRYHYNDENLKGTIDIARHIQKNTPFVGKIAYSQREFSYDNNLMQLIRHTIEFIKGKPYGNRVLFRVKDEVKLVIRATQNYKISNRKRIIDVNQKNILRHAYFREYIALQRLCLFILQQQKNQFGESPRKIYGILFDGAWLWEEYVFSLIKENFYHPMNKSGKDKQILFHHDAGKPKGKIFPDFIGKNKQKRVIADAKYKPIENISGGDYLQVLAYMFRFDAKLGFYLYPEATGDDTGEELFLNRGTTFENNVEKRDDTTLIKQGLRIPMNAKSYDDFVEKIKFSEEIFTKKIAEKIF